MKKSRRFGLRQVDKPSHMWTQRMHYRWYLGWKWTIGRLAIARVRQWEQQPVERRKQQLGIAFCLLIMFWTLSLAFSQHQNLADYVQSPVRQPLRYNHFKPGTLTHNQNITSVLRSDTHQIEKRVKHNHGAQPR